MFKGHSSKYPVEEGNVIRIYKQDVRFNEKLDYVAPHRLYVWIQKYEMRDKNIAGKNRKMTVTFFHIPLIPGEQKNMIQKTTVIRKINFIQYYLRNTKYQVLGNVSCNYTQRSHRATQKLLGIE